MTRYFPVAAAALCLAGPPAFGAGDTVLELKGVGLLIHVGGRPVVAKAGSKIDPSAGLDLWKTLIVGGTTTIKVDNLGGSLAPTAKGEVALWLTRDAAPRWEVAHRREKGRGGYYTIRVAEGKYRGWYLCARDKGEKVKLKGGKEVTAYPLYLVEKPKEVPRWELTEISP